MLSKVEADDLHGNTLSLPLADVSSGYILKEIQGLDPVKATIVSSSFAQLDGSQQQAARRENRNVILTIGIEPYSGGSTVRSLRAALYDYFMPKTRLDLRFFDDGVHIATLKDVQVESCETSLFSKDPELNISIIAFNPNFFDPTELTEDGYTVSSASSVETTLNYGGSVETGYRLRLLLDRSLSGFSVFMRRPNGTAEQLDFTAGLVSGDVVEISTEFRNKYAQLTHASVTSSALFYVDKASKWSALWPGDNYIRVRQSDTGVHIPWEIIYTPKYGGL